jgi:hypothetical protein
VFEKEVPVSDQTAVSEPRPRRQDGRWQLATPAGFNSDDSDGADTDEELKETFAAGLKNKVAAMRQKLAEMQAKPELPWRRSPPSSPTRGTCTARSRPWRPSARRRRPPWGGSKSPKGSKALAAFLKK